MPCVGIRRGLGVGVGVSVRVTGRGRARVRVWEPDLRRDDVINYLGSPAVSLEKGCRVSTWPVLGTRMRSMLSAAMEASRRGATTMHCIAWPSEAMMMPTWLG